MQRIQASLVQLVVFSFRWIPFPLLYFVSGILRWSLFRITGYRKKVVLRNLSAAFPDKAPSEIDTICRSFYRYFSDMIVETIKGFYLSKEETQRRFVYKNPEIFDPLFREGKSAILLGSHYGNWEWGVLTFPLAVKHQVIGIYKPLKNRHLDNYLNRLRKKWGLHLSSMRQAGRMLVENRDKPTIFVLIADQTPSDTKNAIWLPFLNQDTPFIHGPEKMAIQTGYPVFMYEIRCIKRGYYEVSFSLLEGQPQRTLPGEITGHFASRLEKALQSSPAPWLWSHRRWKRSRPNATHS